MIKQMTTCCVKDLGLVDYQRTYVLQEQLVDDLLNGGPQTLLLCEHPDVLTLGRLADEKNMLIDGKELVKKGIDVHPIDRGGDITLHAPGQLVVYPILNLANFGKDLRRYLYRLEQVAIDLLGGFDIVASRFPGQTGVWTQGKKIASIGIGVRKWIAFHGLAINVNTDLNLFSMIRPCGLDVEMTSIAAARKQAVCMHEVKERMTDCFFRNFQLERVRN
ncbi:MAG: lipoyl(octanoyl) transferase LipB [Candidatus Omnitrophica bacterium]|nr:lipoyl(octanoyl) transferase LipB [Candidatus Omnitrophota bacterium]